MSKLVIVESPAKAKNIKGYLGKGYEVVALWVMLGISRLQGCRLI